MTSPVVCEVSAAAAKVSREGLLPRLAAQAIGREETADGYRLLFRLSLDTVNAIESVIDKQRECCRWLRFRVSVPADDKRPIVLTLSGPHGAREFLAALFDA